MCGEGARQSITTGGGGRTQAYLILEVSPTLDKKIRDNGFMESSDCGYTALSSVKMQHIFFPSFIWLGGGNEVLIFTLHVENKHEKLQPKGSIFQKYLSTWEEGLKMKVYLEPSLSFTAVV